MAGKEQAAPGVSLDTTRLGLSPPRPSMPQRQGDATEWRQEQQSAAVTNELVCSICLEVMVTGTTAGRRLPLYTTECGHQYHYQCIAKSCACRGGTCPLCRACIWAPPVPGNRRQTEQHKHLVVGARGQALLPPLILDWEWLPRTRQLKGDVSGYPGAEDGSPISTSAISTAVVHWASPGILDTVTATSSSGSRYRLGQPRQSFVELVPMMAGIPEWLVTVLDAYSHGGVAGRGQEAAAEDET